MGKKKNIENGLSDEQYYNIMRKVAKENNQKWNEYRTKEGEKQLSVEQDYTRLLNSNDYDYRGYYNKYPESSANADTHWPDEFKTVWHPTFSVESRYSGIKDSKYNPIGLPGGFWSGDIFIPRAWQFLENKDYYKPKYQLGGFLNLLKNSMQTAAIAENPAVMTASGYKTYPNGTVTFNHRNDKGVKLLRNNLTNIGEAAITAPTAVEGIEGLATIIRHPIRTGKALVKGAKEGIKGVKKLVRRPVKTPKITPQNAASITPELWTAAQKAAIVRGDMVEALRLSDLHGEINGYKIKGSHASKVSDDFTEFNTDIKLKGTNMPPSIYNDYRDITAGAFFGDNSKGVVNQFGKPRDFLLRIDKPLQADAYGMRYNNLLPPGTTREDIIKEVNNLRSKGYTEEQIDSWIKGQLTYTADDYALKVFNDDSYDGAIIKNIYEGHMNPDYMEDAIPTTDYIITKPNQAKLADAVTYDDNGQIIPLGERHNRKINDSRYGLIPFVGLTGLTLYNNK